VIKDQSIKGYISQFIEINLIDSNLQNAVLITLSIMALLNFVNKMLPTSSEHLNLEGISRNKFV
jgi:hypothetical protein